MTIEVATLTIASEKNGIPTYARDLTKTYNLVMAANVDYKLEVPPGSSIALLNASNEFFVSDSTITLPGAAFAESNALLAPTGVWVSKLAYLHFRTASASTILSVSFYAGCSGALK